MGIPSYIGNCIRKKTMRHSLFSYRISLLVTFVTFLLLPLENAFAHPVGSNGWHLNSAFQAKHNADLVCKVQVLSVYRGGDYKGGLSDPGQNMARMIANSKVLSVIKGECPEVIDIEFHYPEDEDLRLSTPLGQFYTELSEGEVCIVFLKKSESCYKLGRIRSKVRVQPKIVDYSLGDTPNLRLLAEFLVGCNSRDEMVKLQSAEELGYLGDSMIRNLRSFRADKELFQKIAISLGKTKQALKKMHSCQNPVIRNVSIISSFQADDSPGIEAPLKLLRLNSAKFDQNQSMKKYGIRDFCISSLQLRLLETMDATTRRAVVDLKNGSVIRRKDGGRGIFRGVRDFDYATFFNQALDCEIVKNSEGMRKAIANVLWIRYEDRTVPEMIKLLDDPIIHIRRTAVSALRKCVNANFSNSWELRKDGLGFGKSDEKSPEERLKDYQDNEQQYIQHWKKWWQANKDTFKISEEK